MLTGRSLDSAGQMTHFTKEDGMNVFRLPVAWQFLVGGKLGGTLDANNFRKYDQLVKACLATGASCIVDVSLTHSARPVIREC